MLNTLRLSFLLLSAALGLSSCFALREARIESDYSYSGDFRRYRTYDFVSGEGIIADSSRLGQALREAISGRLRQQGYKPAAGQKRPDLLVNFKLFEGTTKFRGYQQEELETWIKRAPVEDENTPEQERHGYDPVRMLMVDGTLLVTLVDARNQRAVWNGYASGVELPTGPLAEVILRRSVRSIFDRYRVFTEGYLDSPVMPTSGN
ncbi:DUF4136 domain-containing protein [uncultured Hymenobacter sp.]|uniref:DUF4136 domain-containing protein n=1 Tax=uncultured Hymenobacter sp. TaxID=170016 RepID=UPI0035CA9660